MAVDNRWAGAGASRPLFAATLALMLTALVVGGVANHSPLGHMAVELEGLAVLLLALWHIRGTRPDTFAIAGYALLTATFLIPLVQLIRLPPAWWQSLPGRATLAQAIALEGLKNPWRPISLDPDDTWRCVLFLLGPAGMFFGAVQCDARQRGWLAVAVLAMGLVSLLIGALQVASASSGVHNFYNQLYDGLPCGIFANRNHQAVFMVCCVVVASTLPSLKGLPGWLRNSPAAVFGLMFLFGVGAAATLSRAGILLLAPALIAAGTIYLSQAQGRRSWLGLLLFGVGLVGAVGLIVTLKGGAILDRFRLGQVGDLRFDALPKNIALAKSYMPLGSGLGSFDMVYRAHELPSQLMPFFLNHVHNDYVEAWMEAGAPAIAVGLAFAAWWIAGTVRAWRRLTVPELTLARAATAFTGCLLAHSTLDYPLRTPALAVLFAFGCALLFTDGSGKAAARLAVGSSPRRLARLQGV